jgi:hypothetical protein
MYFDKIDDPYKNKEKKNKMRIHTTEPTEKELNLYIIVMAGAGAVIKRCCKHCGRNS